MKSPSYNQTQFATEDPLVHGRIELPPEEIDPEELAQKRALAREQFKKVARIAGSVLIVLALSIMLIALFKPKKKSSTQATEEPVVTPQAKDLTLREEIDQLMLEVDKSNRASRTLVFPPVEAEIRVELP